MPDGEEDAEADGEGIEAEKDLVELVVGVGHFGGDDDEGEGEAEDDVGEVVDARAGGAAEAEAVLLDVSVGNSAWLRTVYARGSRRAGLDGADHAGGEGEERADELEYAADHDADQTEGQQDQPDEGVEDQSEQG